MGYVSERKLVRRYIVVIQIDVQKISLLMSFIDVIT